MEKYRGATISIGVTVGFIVFTITVFIIPPQRALALGVLVAASFTFILSLLTDISFKKYKYFDDAIKQDEDIILKNVANYYRDKLISDGILYLTADKLIFVTFKKKIIYRAEIPLSDIKRATYGKLFRNILGLKLFMADSTVQGFVLQDIESFLEYINNKVMPDSFEESE